MMKNAAILLCSFCACACAKSTTTEQSGVNPEVSESEIKLDLPPVPAFEDPAPYPDGTHSVVEMRRHGKRFLEQKIRITGYVTWKYDCVEAIGEKAAKETPELCDRPNFYLGDAPDAGDDKVVWVADVPRELRADEKKVFEKEQIANLPPVPVYSRGQKVIVEGTWRTKTDLGFANEDGVLQYSGLTVIP